MIKAINYELPASGIWFEKLIRKGEFCRQAVSDHLRFIYITLTKIEGIQFPAELDVYHTHYKLRVSGTLYDTRDEVFVSNTYKSPPVMVVINDIVNFMDSSIDDNDDDDHNAPPPVSLKAIKSKQQVNTKPLTNYQHQTIWMGFYANRDLYLKETRLVVEILLYEYDNVSRQEQGFRSLGYSMIDLNPKLTYADVYLGNPRDLCSAMYQRDQNLSNLNIKYKIKKTKKTRLIISKLVGNQVLFGFDDQIPGFKQARLPDSVHDIIYDYDISLDYMIHRVQIYIYKVVELDVYTALRNQQISLSKQENIFITRTEFVQVVAHNGWRAVNVQEYKNVYQLETLSSEGDFNEYCCELVRADRIFNGCVMLFQIKFVYDITIEEIKQTPVELYMGWFAISPNTELPSGKEETYIKGNGARIFEDEAGGNFIRYTTRFAGKVVADFTYKQYKPAELVQLNNEEVKDVMELRKEQLRYDDSTLKNRIINQSINRKIQMKTGKFKDEIFNRQNKVITEVLTLKEENQRLITDMINQDIQLHRQNQLLLGDLHEVIVLGKQNFTLTKERYMVQERKIIEYQERKAKLDEIEFKQTQYKQPELRYYDSYPPLKIMYRSSYQDFYSLINFGSVELPHKIYPEKTLYDGKYLKISFEFSQFMTQLTLLSQLPQAIYELPSIYDFDYQAKDIQILINIQDQQILTTLDNTAFAIVKKSNQFVKFPDPKINTQSQIPIQSQENSNQQSKLHASQITDNQDQSDYSVIVENLDIQKCVVEIFNGVIIMGRLFVLINEATRKYDIVNYNNEQAIGSIVCSVHLEELNECEFAPQRSKIISMKGQTIRQMKLQKHYDDQMRLYVPSIPYQLKMINPIVLDPQNCNKFNRVQSNTLQIKYYSHEEIDCVGNDLEGYIDFYDTKGNLIRCLRILVEVCQSLTFDSHLGTQQELYVDCEDSYVFNTRHPYLLRCKQVANVCGPHRLAINCTTYTQRSQSLLSLNNQIFMVDFIPKDNPISELYEISITKGESITKSIQYTNLIDKRVVVQFIPSHNLISLDIQVCELQGFETKTILCTFAQSMTKKAQVRIYVNDPHAKYYDCLLFKLTYHKKKHS